MTLTPQQLIDLPGYGNAEKELRKAGMWDDTATMDGTKKFEFAVKITGCYEPKSETKTYKVKAFTKDEAFDKADALCDFDDIIETEIVSAKEATT